MSKDFRQCYKSSVRQFGVLHKKQISKVIYYLELEDHGNLPVIYKMEAYSLLDLRELRPEISAVKKKLYKCGMVQIDVPGKLEDMPEANLLKN